MQKRRLDLLHFDFRFMEQCFSLAFVLFGRAVHVSVVTITVGSSVICQPCMKIRGALNLVHTIFVLYGKALSYFACVPLACPTAW